MERRRPRRNQRRDTVVGRLLARTNSALPVGKRAGYVTPLLYKNVPADGGTLGSLGCQDITQGNNSTAAVGGYSAQPGYDAVTGWGTKGSPFLAALKTMI